jgi:3-hydroxyacyl-CoA dehydrogenase
MSAERVGKTPEAVIAELFAFAERVGARVVLPTPGFVHNIFAKTNVQETWKRFGWDDNRRQA